jgi:uncharacterized coiled-coil protein SlyX
MPTRAINLREGEMSGTTICDATCCVGLHHMGQCFTFSEGFELNFFVQEAKHKRMGIATIQKTKDNTTQLCNTLFKLSKMVDNDQTTVKNIYKQIKHIVNKFGGNDPKLRADYYKGCVEILRHRRGFRQIKKHRIPEINSLNDILSAIANWKLNPWIAMNLEFLCRKASTVYGATKQHIKFALELASQTILIH